MAARMISLPLLKGRRVATLRHGAACLMVMVFSLSSWLVLVVVRGACPVGTVVLLPTVLTLGPRCSSVHPPEVRRPPHSRCWSATPSAPPRPERHERRVEVGRRRPYPPSVRSRDGGYDPTFHVGRVSMSPLSHTVLDDVNAVLLKHATNLLNIIHIHAGNTDATLELAVNVINNF